MDSLECLLEKSFNPEINHVGLLAVTLGRISFLCIAELEFLADGDPVIAIVVDGVQKVCVEALCNINSFVTCVDELSKRLCIIKRTFFRIIAIRIRKVKESFVAAIKCLRIGKGHRAKFSLVVG